MPPDAIPRIAHFVFGLAPSDESFHLVHYLAIASCIEVVQPEEIYVHCHELPYGLYWDLIRPQVTLRRIEPAAEVSEFEYSDPGVAYYSYAHHADFRRLDVLTKYGGLYADIDTLFVGPVPDELWRSPAVIGREADVLDPATGRVRGSMSNALLMAAPGSKFIETWRAEMPGALDGSWSAHSCFLAHDIAARLPDTVRVEPQRTFHNYAPTAENLRRLLVQPDDDLDGVCSIHLNAHLWWDELRRDFSGVDARMIDERWIRGADATYAVLARPYLPEHDCF
jgi:Glycosyltransferase sugar-binding region containing DXD motif